MIKILNKRVLKKLHKTVMVKFSDTTWGEGICSIREGNYEDVLTSIVHSYNNLERERISAKELNDALDGRDKIISELKKENYDLNKRYAEKYNECSCWEVYAKSIENSCPLANIAKSDKPIVLAEFRSYR